MTPEDRICLLLARGTLSTQEWAQVRGLLSGGVQWDRIREIAQALEIYPLLYRNLELLGFPSVAPRIREELRALFHLNAFRNEVMAQELAAILRSFHQAGIPLIPLKGLYLSYSIYGDVKLRVSTDIDVLVPKNFVTQAYDLLASIGYRSEVPRWFLTEFLLDSRYEFGMVRKSRAADFLVEIQWGFLWGGFADQRGLLELWREARREKFLGLDVLVLSPEWQLLFLTVHAARHHWQGLKWLVDIHEICTHTRLDWDQLVAAADRMEWGHLVGWTLRMCNSLYQTPVPRNLCGASAPPRAAPFPNSSRLTRWQTTLSVLSQVRGVRCKLRLLFRWLTVPTPVDFLYLPLPASLPWLYYVLRPVRLSLSLLAALRTAVRKLALRTDKSGVFSSN